MNPFLLLPSVFSFFAADPAGPTITLPGITDDQLRPINADFSEQLALIPDVDIELTKLDEDFCFFWGHVTDPVLLRRRAGEWLLSQRLTFEIPRQRLSTLKKQFDVERPPPYDHPALSDLSISSDCLVPIREFDVRGGILIRKGYTFSVLPPVESPNAQYWLMKVASFSEFADYLWVRLDPFLWGPEETFPQMAHLMLWYGKSLDWDRIRNLRSVEHGRWLPEKFSCRSEFTDYTWMPREHEIHFQCEELPVRNSTEARGSRYLHAIYIPDREQSFTLMAPFEFTLRTSGTFAGSAMFGTLAKPASGLKSSESIMRLRATHCFRSAHSFLCGTTTSPGISERPYLKRPDNGV